MNEKYVKACLEKILPQLLGGTIVRGINGGEDWGFMVLTKDGKMKTVWVLADPEGNGPGWLSVEDHKE